MISDENRELKCFKESAMAEVHTLKKSWNFYLSKWKKSCIQVTKVPKKPYNYCNVRHKQRLHHKFKEECSSALDVS